VDESDSRQAVLSERHERPRRLFAVLRQSGPEAVLGDLVVKGADDAQLQGNK